MALTNSESDVQLDLWSRRDFLRYSRQFTLDPNTVNRFLRLSESNTRVSETGLSGFGSDHPDRFEVYNPQVLCVESVSGRCYWEAEWSGVCVYVSVSYKSISRKGEGSECEFGANGQSWTLCRSPAGYQFGHANRWMDVPVSGSSRRVGVFVDYAAGTLSFYSVSSRMSLIHRQKTTFSQPLCPGFRVYRSSSVKLCDMSQ